MALQVFKGPSPEFASALAWISLQPASAALATARVQTLLAIRREIYSEHGMRMLTRAISAHMVPSAYGGAHSRQTACQSAPSAHA